MLSRRCQLPGGFPGPAGCNGLQPQGPGQLLCAGGGLLPGQTVDAAQQRQILPGGEVGATAVSWGDTPMQRFTPAASDTMLRPAVGALPPLRGWSGTTAFDGGGLACAVGAQQGE